MKLKDAIPSGIEESHIIDDIKKDCRKKKEHEAMIENKCGTPVLVLYDDTKALTNDMISLFMSNCNIITGEWNIPICYCKVIEDNCTINCAILHKIDRPDHPEYFIGLLHADKVEVTAETIIDDD